MFKKIAVAGAGFATAVLGSGVAFAQMTTTTLGTAIDDVNGTTYDYFLVLIDKYWPFVVGFGVLVLVWHFGRRILNSFS